MKNHIEIKLICISQSMLLFSVGCTTVKSYNITDVPIHAEKKIITTHYKPLFHEGEWICGERIQPGQMGIHFWGDTVYIDSKERELLKMELDKITKNTYDSIYGKVKLTHSQIFDRYDNSLREEKYVYNEHGFLEEKLINNKVEFKRSYDEKGRLVEEVSDSRKELRDYSPSKDGQLISTYRIIDTSEDSPYYKIEKATEIYSEETKLLQRVIKQEFRYDKLAFFKDELYIYDTENRLIEIRTNGKEIVIGTISAEGDWDESIKNEYFSNPQYEEVIFNEKWEYNQNGDISAYIHNTFGNISEQIQYEYNANGDWKKRVIWPYGACPQGEPKVISIREIVYY